MTIKTTFKAIKNLAPTTFSRHLSVLIGMFVIIAMVFTLYAWSEKQVDRANGLRIQSQQLTSELRQSSDDLTRMVRTYVATDNPLYKKYYQDILDIRNGKKPRPAHYENVYWDFVIAGDTPPDTGSHQSIALLDLMRQANFPEQELQKLSTAMTNPDTLIKIEFEAMRLNEAAVVAEDMFEHYKATLMLHDQAYHQAKAGIMKPINDVTLIMEKRTLGAVRNAELIAIYLRTLLIAFAIGLVFILMRTYSTLKNQLGGTPQEVQSLIANIGTNDLTTAVVVTAYKEDSVLGWLVKMQNSLVEFERERKLTEDSLIRSEAKFYTLFDSTGDAVLMLDEKGFYDCNQAALVLFGLPSKEALRQYHPAQLSPPTQACGTDSNLLAEKYINTAMKEGTARFEWIHQRADSRKSFVTDITLTSLLLDGKLVLQTTIRDISERKQAELELEIAAAAFESQEGMMVTDTKIVILRVNEAFTKITGYSAKEAIGQTPSFLRSGKNGKAFYADMWESINKTGEWAGEIWNRRKNGEIYPEHLSITAVKDTLGVVKNYVATLTDITTRKQAEEQIHNLAFYDPLTQLPNRRLLLDRLEHALASSARSNQRGALLFMDLDHFKTLNDTLGHDVGDLLLQQVAARLTATVREGDTVSRLGGDEFVLLLEGLSEQTIVAAAQTKDIAEKILLALNQAYQINTYTRHCTTSIGATLFNGHEQGSEELLKQADIAMYQSKAKRRNTLIFFDPKMQEVITARADMEHELHKAIEQNQFELYYQVQVDSDGQALGAEALIRWVHPERGMISAFNFIPLAEETGLILPIGQWVLETACAQLKAWEGHVLTRELTISVNVSAKQFNQPTFVKQVQATIQRYAINPGLLKLELTESILVENINHIILTMIALKTLGIKFSLDDFGAGYSSLQYLKKLPLDQLKIDQSFVRDLVVDDSDKVIVLTIITMANSLGHNVIAEGVETEEQRQYLLDNGCTHYQGYLFSKPVPIDEFEALLRKG